MAGVCNTDIRWGKALILCTPGWGIYKSLDEYEKLKKPAFKARFDFMGHDVTESVKSEKPRLIEHYHGRAVYSATASVSSFFSTLILVSMLAICTFPKFATLMLAGATLASTLLTVLCIGLTIDNVLSLN